MKKVYIDRKTGNLHAVLFSGTRDAFKVHVMSNKERGVWAPCLARVCSWRKTEEEAKADLDNLAEKKGLMRVFWGPYDLEKAFKDGEKV